RARRDQPAQEAQRLLGGGLARIRPALRPPEPRPRGPRRRPLGCRRPRLHGRPRRAVGRRGPHGQRHQGRRRRAQRRRPAPPHCRVPG
ncbi:hypothetical protein BN1708_020581, partial [Verticillium longisporum]